MARASRRRPRSASRPALTRLATVTCPSGKACGLRSGLEPTTEGTVLEVSDTLVLVYWGLVHQIEPLVLWHRPSELCLAGAADPPDAAALTPALACAA